MAFRTNEEIDVTVDGGRFFAGPFRSIEYAEETGLARAIAQRFPKAKVGGKPLDVAFPCIKAIPPEQLAPPPKTPEPETEPIKVSEDLPAALERTLSQPEKKKRATAKPKPAPAQNELW